MATGVVKEDVKFIARAIEDRIAREAEQFFEEELEKAKSNLEEHFKTNKDKIIASVAVRIAKTFEIGIVRDTINIKIHVDDVKEDE